MSKQPINLAVLVGVSDYANLTQLTACRTDVERMHRLLLATEKFTDIATVTGNTTAVSTKDSLRSFFRKHKGAEVGDVFFYFSGHGTFSDDLLLCCSDFSEEKPTTTALSNSEIDDLLRSVAPNLAVKVVDACNSGVRYVKNSRDVIEKALRSSELKNIRFMASCQLDQSSFADSTCSFFTRKFVEACCQRDSGDILYRDIEGYLADAFASVPEQRPHFVSQGTGLEVFATVGPELVKLQSELGTVADSKASLAGTDLAAQVEMRVHSEDEKFLSEEEIERAVAEAREHLRTINPKNPLVAKFYDYSIDFQDSLARLPSIESLATSASKEKWQKKYFIQVAERTVRKRVPKQTFALMTALGGPQEYVEREFDEPYSMSATHQLPFEAVIVEARSSHQSLTRFAAVIALVHSRIHVLVLHALPSFLRKGWDEHVIDNSSSDWQGSEILWKEVARDSSKLWRPVVDELEQKIEKYLKGLAPTEPAEPTT